MARNDTITCNRCGRKKEQANHWHLAFKDVHPLTLKSQLTFYKWDEQQSRGEEVMHICSEDCAHKELAEFLA